MAFAYPVEKKSTTAPAGPVPQPAPAGPTLPPRPKKFIDNVVTKSGLRSIGHILSEDEELEEVRNGRG
jgi:hypothetical protein